MCELSTRVSRAFVVDTDLRLGVHLSICLFIVLSLSSTSHIHHSRVLGLSTLRPLRRDDLDLDSSSTLGPVRSAPDPCGVWSRTWILCTHGYRLRLPPWTFKHRTLDLILLFMFHTVHCTCTMRWCCPARMYVPQPYLILPRPPPFSARPSRSDFVPYVPCPAELYVCPCSCLCL